MPDIHSVRSPTSLPHLLQAYLTSLSDGELVQKLSNMEKFSNMDSWSNHKKLEHLQWKVEYLRNDIDMLEIQKTKSTNHLLNLNRRIDEFQGMFSMHDSSLPHKRVEMTYINQESGTYDNIDNLYPFPYSGPDTSLYSIYPTFLFTNEWLIDQLKLHTVIVLTVDITCIDSWAVICLGIYRG